MLLPESLPDPLPESSCGCSAGPVDTSIVTVSPFWKSYPLFPERTSATVPAARSDSTSTELTSRPSCSRLRVAEASDCPMYALGSIVIVSSSCVASAVGVPVGCGAGSPVPPKKIHPTQARPAMTSATRTPMVTLAPVPIFSSSSSASGSSCWGRVAVAGALRGAAAAEAAAGSMTRVASSAGWLKARVTASAAVAAPAIICGTAASAPATSPSRSARAARARASPDSGRRSCFLLSRLPTRRRTGSETVSGISGGAVLTCAIAIATCESPVNGRRPASASYMMMPSEYRSDLGVDPLPVACSGARYCAVPMTCPVLVSGAWSATRAIPKSVSFTRKSGVTRMLPGFTSRWTTPERWAEPRASADCAVSSRTSASGRTTLRSMSEDRGSPGTYSMTRYGEPVSSP